MVDVKSKKCAHDGCSTQPIFNMPDQQKGIYCSEHKLPGMVDVVSKRCAHDRCSKQPTYNMPDQKKGLYCFEHKLPGMVDVKSKKCAHDGCSKIPAYNMPGQRKRLYCSEHKLPGMIDVLSKRCLHDGCSKIPGFNMPDQKKGLYCSEHKLDGMVDVVHERCAHDGCSKHPTYNMPDQKKGLYCKEHKLEAMVDVVNKKCAHDGCSLRPYFNMPDQKTGIYCSEHKLPGMVSTQSKKCQVPRCKHDALYGKSEHHRAQFCEKHRHDGHIHVFKERQCSMCEKDYAFVLPETRAKYCMEHCPNEEFENAVKRLCKYCDLRESSKFVCVDCVQRSHKKEWGVVKHLRKHIDTRFKYDDYHLNTECTRRRPDIHFDLATHSVIVEVDEGEHKDRSDSCECARLNEIVNSIGGKPVVFVRYNPDAVYHQCIVRNISPSDRIDLLVDVIKRELMRTHEQFSVQLIQLWYSDDCPVYMREKREDLTSRLAV